MTVNSTDVDHWNQNNGLSIVHRRLCYHFKEYKHGYVSLTCVDELDSDVSYRDQEVPAIPKAVHKRLSAEGKRLIA